MIATLRSNTLKSKIILTKLLDLKSIRLNHEYQGKTITQKEIAKHLNITVSTFQKYEKSYYQDINLSLLVKTLKFLQTKNLFVYFENDKLLHEFILQISFDLPFLRRSAKEKITQKMAADYLNVTLSTFQRYEKNYYQIIPINLFIKLLEYYESKGISV